LALLRAEVWAIPPFVVVDAEPLFAVFDVLDELLSAVMLPAVFCEARSLDDDDEEAERSAVSALPTMPLEVKLVSLLLLAVPADAMSAL